MLFINKSNFTRRGKKLWFNIVTTLNDVIKEDEDGIKEFYNSAIEINLSTQDVKINYTMYENNKEVKLSPEHQEFIINKALEIVRESKYI